MAAKTYRKTALVTAEQFLPAIGQIPKGVYSDGHGDPRKRLDCRWVLDTKEGRHDVRGGDYICTGPAGEQWNVAAEIFEATYEEVPAALSAQVQDVAVDGADIGRCIRSLSVEHPLKWAEAEKTPILRGWFVGQVMKHFGGKPDGKLVRELIDTVFAMYPASPASKQADAG